MISNKVPLPKLLERREQNREYDARRRNDQPLRKLYSTKAWQQLRQRVFLRDGYTCRMCERIEAHPHADHIKPHKGDLALFWDESNVQTLCPDCHNTDKQRIERGGKARQAVGPDGWPIEASTIGK